ncbi:MAG: Cys-rich peptide radical SAM maturase CcpM [Clostridium sp.]|nr:Cys-rich peptide radical SAM maturase CcpM [Clostridium sp.]
MKNVIFKCFKTLRGYYVYDRFSNTVININKTQYEELLSVQNGNIKEEESGALRTLQESGALQINNIEKIYHPETDYLEHHLDKRVAQLILQVTQQCNLRCEYCVYSGNYYNRTHNAQRMNWDTAKDAIDFFINHSRESKEVVISFYGGEPILEMELIMKSISYIESRIEGKNVVYAMTTNGTLLNESNMKYFAEKNFKLMISLDGSKEEHDRNRKFINGNGTFDIIINNVKKFKKSFPVYVSENVHFNTVISPKANLSCIEEYFSTDDVLADQEVMFNMVNTSGMKDESNFSFSKQFNMKRKYEYLKLLLMLVGKCDKSRVSKLVIESAKQIRDNYKDIRGKSHLTPIYHPSGPCVPGVDRLFVTVKGDFYPCEKVPELGYAKIGSLAGGYEISNIEELLNIGRMTETQCKECWALQLCSICSQQLECKGECAIGKEAKVRACSLNKTRALEDLMELAVLSEFGYKYQEEIGIK